jgi:PKHD-type hydroxylase
MIFQIEGILGTEAIENIRQSLKQEADTFASGKSTAGWYAKGVKHNDQSSGPAAIAAMEEVKAALLAHPVFMSAARPKSFIKTLVSRYQPGMHYGLHVDDALMAGVRTDLSFTLFLSDPATYDGGELSIEEQDGDTRVKLSAGSVVLYQTTSLHQVAEVTRGERLAVVGWVRSYIRSPEQRAVLFELDQTVAALRAADVARTTMNSVMKVRNSLTRMWAED